MVPCTLLILAGGKSRRMGRDKATLPAGATTLTEHIAARLAATVDETLVAAGHHDAIGTLETVADQVPGGGPLRGMQAGLTAANHPLVWVVACDLPDVQPALLAILAAAADGVDAVVPIVAGEPQGVCALYRRASVLPVVERLLQQGRHSVKSLLGEINVRYLPEAELRPVDPELRSFRNLNTPADYEAWLRQR